MTIFEIGDISPQEALAANIDTCPFKLETFIFLIFQRSRWQKHNSENPNLYLC